MWPSDDAASPPLSGVWHSDITSVQLQFTFIDQNTRQPVELERTFMSFYDFDEGSDRQAECIQFDGTQALTQVPNTTELEQVTDQDSYDRIEARMTQDHLLDSWDTPIYCGATRGFGKDNPTDPDTLTEEQR